MNADISKFQAARREAERIQLVEFKNQQERDNYRAAERKYKQAKRKSEAVIDYMAKRKTVVMSYFDNAPEHLSEFIRAADLLKDIMCAEHEPVFEPTPRAARRREPERESGSTTATTATGSIKSHLARLERERARIDNKIHNLRLQLTKS